MNNALLYTCLLCLALCCQLHAKHPESYYQKIAAEIGGAKTEVVMPDGSRCDIVTDEYAIEVDWPNNWDSLGQSLNYGFQANKKAGIFLIIEAPKDSLRLMSLIEHYKLPITVWTIHAETLEIKKLN